MGGKAQTQAPRPQAQDRAHARTEASHHAHRVPVPRVCTAGRARRRRSRRAHQPLRQERGKLRLRFERHTRDAAGQSRHQLRLGHLQSGMQAGRRHHDRSDLHQLLRSDELAGELRQRLLHHGGRLRAHKLPRHLHRAPVRLRRVRAHLRRHDLSGNHRRRGRGQ